MARVSRIGALVPPLALAIMVAAQPAQGQGVPRRSSSPGGELPPTTISRPVVQPVPGKDGRILSAALGRLARDPRDIEALVDAGNAALAMGDVDAATGFFRRADQVAPGNPRVKAGLAGAMVRSGDPFGAIPLFDEAEKAGPLDGALMADRGLAYDLVGENATAQRLYRQALTRAPNDEIVRRLALSLAIVGDKQGAEQILSPLLQQRNLSAWRTRAFALAILGKADEAVNIANTILPSELAGEVAPYLRYMSRLTRAQQAAAANFGAFPRASEIGRDDPRVAQFATRRASVAAVDAALTPRGEPLGRNSRTRDRRASRAESAQAVAASERQAAAARVAPPDPQPAREVAGIFASAAALASGEPTAPVEPAQPAQPAQPVQPVQPAPARPVQSARVAAMSVSPTSAPAPAPTPASMRMAPGFTAAPKAAAAAAHASVTQAPPAAATAPISATPRPAPARAEPPPKMPRGLAEAFAEFGRPTTDATPVAGAVDLRRIKPTRPKPVESPKPPPPSHPSRIWVQVATGRDNTLLGGDWRRMTRKSAEVFKGKQAFISDWGQTNRLLTGPFESESTANSFIAQLRRVDVNDAFVWTSPAGQVVDTLPTATQRR